jgi:hypothetical protein
MLTNYSENPHARVRDERTIDQLLESVRLRFYAGRPDPRDFHRDRRALLYALTWPSVWLDRRNLVCSPERYRSLITDRLHAIGAHGDPACYSAYFPAYLLKCLQDFFERHGDELYGELKHIRNALDQLLASARFAARIHEQSRHLDVLVATHRHLHAQRACSGARDSRQLDLF